MAEICACGCGRKAPFGRGGAAKALANLVEALDIWEDRSQQWLELTGGIDDRSRAIIKKQTEEGRLIKQHLISHIHKTARPGVTPDLMRVNQALNFWREETLHYLQQLFDQ